jgi:hypothetical protein
VLGIPHCETIRRTMFQSFYKQYVTQCFSPSTHVALRYITQAGWLFEVLQLQCRWGTQNWDSICPEQCSSALGNWLAMNPRVLLVIITSFNLLNMNMLYLTGLTQGTSNLIHNTYVRNNCKELIHIHTRTYKTENWKICIRLDLY